MKQIHSDKHYLLKIALRNFPKRVALEFFFCLLNEGKIAFYSIIFLRFIFWAIEVEAGFEKVVIFVGITSFLYLIMIAASNWYYECYCPIVDIDIGEYISKLVFNKAAEEDLSSYEDTEFYNKYTVVINEIQNNLIETIKTSMTLVSSIIIAIFIGINIYMIDREAILLVTLPLGLILVFGRYFNGVKYKLYLENVSDYRRKEYVKRMIYLNESAKELRLYNIFDIFTSYVTESTKNIIQRIKKQGFKIALLRGVGDNIVLNLMYYGTIIYATVRILWFKNLLISEYFILVNAIIQLWRVLSNISAKLVGIHRIKKYNMKFVEFMKHTPEINMNEEGLLLNEEFIDIKLKDVSFCYREKDKPTLQHINMQIRQGQKIAIVGSNGSGKSTLIKILLRLYEPTQGCIVCNDNPVGAYQTKAYRKLFATVFQDYKLFALSVKENIILGNEHYAKDVDWALENSGLSEKMQKLSKGIDTVLTKEFEKDGAVLSGGEMQKLAISRALVRSKQSKIVIFDEPTSAIDPISEKELYKNIFKECVNKTVIYISHRLTTAQLADYIYVMESGRIIEQGSHKELMSKQGKYAELYNKQAESYRL